MNRINSKGIYLNRYGRVTKRTINYFVIKSIFLFNLFVLHAFTYLIVLKMVSAYSLRIRKIYVYYLKNLMLKSKINLSIGGP